MPRKSRFSARHPFLFGVLLIIVAVALITGATATFRFLFRDGLSAAFADTKIGQVNVVGFIADSRPVCEWIAELRDNPDVKGVLLRVDSGGGLVAPSQEMFQAVKALAEVKPVIASFGSAAASGGYYVAAPATTIVANPASMTGSIGVKAELANAKGLMEKIGVGEITIASGDLKAVGSPFRPLTDKEKAYVHSLVMELYAQFVDDIATARDLTKERIVAIADGRAMTGRQALDLGLVDSLGGYQDAMDMLKAVCGITERVPLLEGPKEDIPLIEHLLGATLDRTMGRSLTPSRWVFVF